MLALGIGFLGRLSDPNRPLLPAWLVLATGIWMFSMGIFSAVGIILNKIHLSGVMSAKGLGHLFGFGLLFSILGIQNLKANRKRKNRTGQSKVRGKGAQFLIDEA